VEGDTPLSQRRRSLCLPYPPGRYVCLHAPPLLRCEPGCDKSWLALWIASPRMRTAGTCAGPLVLPSWHVFLRPPGGL